MAAVVNGARRRLPQHRTLSRRHRGFVWRRLSVHWEPVDLWVGVFIGGSAVYVCLLPTLVVAFARGRYIPGVGEYWRTP